MDSGIVVVVYIFIQPGQEIRFRQFETEAVRIMCRYGGQVEKVIRPLVYVQAAPLPHEIHVISFPSIERYEAYRADTDLAELAPLRQSAIARTEITIGAEGEPYPSSVRG